MGALTRTASESPIFMELVFGLVGVTGGSVFSVSWSMPKVVATVAETVKSMVAVAPTAVALTVTAPAVAPLTLTANTPLALVVPLAGVNVTPPAPAWVNTTVAPGITVPPASLAVTVSISVPPTSIDVACALNVSVDPIICTGSKLETVPADAVIVAVRLAFSNVPDEKVTDAIPVASVVTVPALSRPVSVLKVIVSLGTAALPELTAAIVIVALFELSDFTVVGAADIWRLAIAVGLAVTGAVSSKLSPHPDNVRIITASETCMVNLAMIFLYIQSRI
jgi:hypothetical protein